MLVQRLKYTEAVKLLRDTRCNDCFTHKIGMRKCFTSTSVLYHLCRMQRMKFTTLRAIIVAVYVTLSMAKDTGWLVARFATHILRMTLSWISIDSDKTTCMQMSRSEMISLTRLATALVKVWHKIFILLFQWSTILYNSYHLTGQNNCWKNWIKCAGKVAACAAECMNNTTSQSCISCLTPLYSECKYCFYEIEESQKSGNKMQYTICCTTLTIGIYNYHNWT